MKYYKTVWNEIVGEEEWGNSVWYLEISEDGYPNRQIEVFENGPRLKYDLNHLEDEYGGLGDQKMNESEAKNWGEEISNSHFEVEWNIKARNQE